MKSQIKCVRISFVVLLSLGLLAACKEATVEPEMLGSMAGTVKDAVTGLPIEGATVTTNPATSAMTTDEQGRFNLGDIPVGSYTVQALKSGYVKNVVSVSVDPAEVTTVDIMLNESTTGNNPPDKPHSPAPAHGALNVMTEMTLFWSCTDPDKDDSLTYDVTVYESNMSDVFASYRQLGDTSVAISGLRFNTSYYWQVKARDMEGLETHGEMWTFTTRPLPANPYVFSTFRDGNFEIYSSDTTQRNTVRLTVTPHAELWPRWNYRRDRIAFSSNDIVERHIYTMRPDGTQRYRVTSLPVTGYHNEGVGFCWSADGGWIYYSYYNRIFRVNPYGANIVEVATAPQDRHYREVDVSGQNDRIVALALGKNEFESEVYIMDINGGNRALLMGDVPGVLGSPSFSVDGRWVMFTQDLSGYEVPDGRQLDAHVMLVSVDGADTLDVSVNKIDGTNDLYPRFSADGANIIFTNMSNNGSGKPSLWIMDRMGLNRRKIVDDAMMGDWR